MTINVSIKELMAFKGVKKFKPYSLEKKLHTTRNQHDGIYSAMRHAMLFTRLLGLLPLSGLCCSTSHQLRYTVRSSYVIFYTASLFGQLLMFFMTFVWVIEDGISLRNFTNFFFNFSSLTSSIILWNIAKNWPDVVASVEGIEAVLPPFRNNVTKACNIAISVILLCALVEHLLSISFGYTVALDCGEDDVIETFFRSGMPWIFKYTTYALWKGIILELISFQSTYIWSLNDLLIIILSIYLTEHLVIHNALLKMAVNQEHFSAREFRLQYLNVVSLIQLINRQVGIFILASFGSNLFWICTQLFNSLNQSETGHFTKSSCNTNLQMNNTYEPHISHGIQHAIYFTFSFSFIVLRTLLVLLLASRIHSNSKIPLVYLYGLPTEKYTVEVERFIAQINNITVALSGLDFFYVTRSMILTLLGTIVTYELVMLQFNKLPSTLFARQKLNVT